MKFVVATDGSSQSRAAIEHALDVVEAADGSLTAVHAVDPNVYEEPAGDPIADLPDAENRLVIEDVEDAEQRGEDILADAAGLAAARGHDLQTELLHGEPTEVIPQYAEENGFDGLIAGHRPRSGDRERVLGSVAKGLIDRCAVPVTIVQ